MKRLIVFSSLAILIGLIALVYWHRYYRYEILADSGLDDLYTFYPEIIDKIVEKPELARRVLMVHLSVSDFGSAELKGRDFSSLARLPSLTTVECTYSHNVDTLVPILNQIATLDDLRLYYCEPVEQTLQHLHSDSLRSIQFHTYSILEIPYEVTNAFAHRMPKCVITFTTD